MTSPGRPPSRTPRTDRAETEAVVTEDKYELPDFHPETGHLHTCNRVGPCECAARLYELVEDALIGIEGPDA